MGDKGYYYLRLKENFFDSEELKLIEGMENGYLYSNILLKMYLKALKSDGRLVFNDVIPYNTKMLATITGHNVDIVEKAINIFNEMHLIEILDNGAIYMMNMQQLIGSISSEGIRKAEYREKIKLEKEQGTKLGQCPDIISISNSISNSIYKSIFDYWNSKNIIVHRELTDDIKKTIIKALKIYTEEQIKEYIDRYATVINDDNYFFGYRWTLVEFLNRKDGISSFTDDGSKWVNYCSSKTQMTVKQPKRDNTMDILKDLYQKYSEEEQTGDNEERHN